MAKLTQCRMHVRGRMVDLDLRSDEPMTSARVKLLPQTTYQPSAGAIPIEPAADSFRGGVSVERKSAPIDEVQITAEFVSGRTYSFSVYRPPMDRWIYCCG